MVVTNRRCRWAYLSVALMCAACGPRDTTVEFYVADGYHFSQAERRGIEDLAEATAVEARRVLPALPHHLSVRVYAGTRVIPETGEAGEVVPPSTVIWTVDPAHAGGVLTVVHTWLRASLLHEFHHLVRAQTSPSTSLMDEVVTEGMATVFERDVTGASPLWGLYPDDVGDWVKELTALPPDVGRDYWLRARHPDGRRWIGMRAGAYLVDRAIQASGRSAAALVSTSTRELMDTAAAAIPSR